MMVNQTEKKLTTTASTASSDSKLKSNTSASIATSTGSNNMNLLPSNEMGDKLIDSLRAWNNSGKLVSDIGAFVIEAKIRITKRKLNDLKKRSLDGDNSDGDSGMKRRKVSSSPSIEQEQRNLAEEVRKIQFMKHLMTKMKESRLVIENDMLDMIDEACYHDNDSPVEATATTTTTTNVPPVSITRPTESSEEAMWRARTNRRRLLSSSSSSSGSGVDSDESMNTKPTSRNTSSRLVKATINSNTHPRHFSRSDDDTMKKTSVADTTLMSKNMSAPLKVTPKSLKMTPKQPPSAYTGPKIVSTTKTAATTTLSNALENKGKGARAA